MESEKQAKTKKGLAAKKIIYDSAIQLMNTRGYENTSISDICKNAGFAVGNFYHYFNSKIDILKEFVHLHNVETVDFYAGLDCSSNVEKIKRLTVYQMEKKDCLSKDFVAKLFAIDFLDNNILKMQSHAYLKLIHELVIKAQDNNEITRKLSPEEISELIINNTQGLVASWLYIKTQYSLKEATEKSFDVLLGLLKTDW